MKKLPFKSGQLVEQTMNGIRGIVLGLQHAPHNSHYNKAVIYCIFAPYNSSLVGQTLKVNAGSLSKVNADGLKDIDEKSV